MQEVSFVPLQEWQTKSPGKAKRVTGPQRNPLLGMMHAVEGEQKNPLRSVLNTMIVSA
jgi:hypothetical protein